MRKLGMLFLLSFTFCCIFLLWFLILKFPLGFLQIDKYLGFFFGLLNLMLTLLTIQIINYLSKSNLFKRKFRVRSNSNKNSNNEFGGFR